MTRKTFILTTVAVLLATGAGAQEPVGVGRGSYAAYAPLAVSRSADHGGDQSRYMQYRQLNIRERAGVPIPTNDWWTDLINADRERGEKELTGQLWSYPQCVQGMTYGIDVHFPKYWVDNGTEMKAQSKLMVKAQLATAGSEATDGRLWRAARPMAETWSDWTVGFSLLPDGAGEYADAASAMFVTLAHGVPFTWIETKGVSPVISAAPTGADGADNHLKGKTTLHFTDAAGADLTAGPHSRFVLNIDDAASPGNAQGDCYGIYLPEGSTVALADGEAKVAYAANGPQFVVVALLHSPAELDTYADYAYARPTDTQVSWHYAQADGLLTTHFAVQAEDLRTGTSTDKVLQGFIPHHYRGGAMPAFDFTDKHYRTPRGMLKLAAGNELDVAYRFSGMLPCYALPTDTEGGAGSYDAAKMLQMLGAYAQKGEFGADTYWGGKGLTQMALYMMFAREMGEEQLFRQCHDRLKEALVDWMTYTPGEANFFFARDPRFGGLIGYATSYDSDTYNDHHFHYGYFTLASALLALVDDDFRAGYGEMVRLVARDYNNYRRDSWSCFLRMMDPWAGHCYAGGMGDGGGNGQESTSESMQAWGGMYLLGVALGDDELRDAGLFGWVNESRATAEYWFDRHGDAITNDFHTTAPDYDAADIDHLYNIDYTKFVHRTNGTTDYIQPWSSNLTSHGVGWWTWFGGDPVFMQGIQWMPISPALDYLGEDKAFAAWDYERLMAIKEHVGWEDYSGDAAWLGNSDWGNVVLSYRQWSDPDDAARIFDEGWDKGWGTMTTSTTGGITYFVTHSHRSYGDIVWDVTASVPTARTYEKNGVRTHMAYNPTDAALTVRFSDGASLVVPARQLKVEGVESAACTYIYPIDNSEEDLRDRLSMKNLALGKPCTESSHENAGTLPSYATDGKLDTRWGSEHRDNEWLQVDLGERADIYKVRIRWEASYASEYRIELRDEQDGTPTHSAVGMGKGNDWTELTLGDHPARFVRIVGVKRASAYGTSLYELEVYGRPESAAGADLMGVEIACGQSVLKQGVASELTLQGYDFDKNPKDVAAEWNSTQGLFDGQQFTPTAYGQVSVTATVGDLIATKTLVVEEALRPTDIALEVPPQAVVGSTVSFTSQVNDQFGQPFGQAVDYEAQLDNDGTLEPTSNLTIDAASMTFTSTVTGNYVIIATAGDLQATCRVSIIDASAENLALGRPAEASYGAATAAVDGQSGTRWESEQADDAWWYVQLSDDAPVGFDKLSILWEAAYAQAFRVFTADMVKQDMGTGQLKMTNARQVLAVNNQHISNVAEKQEYQLAAPAAGCYVVFQCVKRATEWGCSFFEFEVYNTGTATANFDVATASIATSFVIDGVPTDLGLTVLNSDGRDISFYDEVSISSPQGTYDKTSGLFTATSCGTAVLTISGTNGSETTVSTSVIESKEAPSDVQGQTVVLAGTTKPSMNFSYNGGSEKVSDSFAVADGNEALHVRQLGTCGFGPLDKLDLGGANMIHADIYVKTDVPDFSIHIEGAPENRIYSHALAGGQWNSIDLPIANTTANWIFFSFSDYAAGSNEAIIANVYFHTETGDRLIVGTPDSKGLVSVSSFGRGVTDDNREAFLATLAALPTTATAIDLSNIPLTNTDPMTIVTANPNVVILLAGSGGDAEAASDQQFRLANTHNLVYNSGGWHLPLKATGYKLEFVDGYPIYPVNFGGNTKLSYTRTLQAGSYATTCLPRALTLPAHVEAYELASAEADEIHFTRVGTSTLAAYTPYLLRNVGDSDIQLTIDNVAGNVELARAGETLTKTADAVSFVGNFQQFRVSGAEGYAGIRPTGQMAWLDNSGTTVGAFRAYLEGVTAAHMAKMKGSIWIDGQAVNIEAISIPRTTDPQVFDLQGRPVGRLSDKAKLPRGLYIVGGQKFFVK